MVEFHAACLLSIAVGFVSAGIVGSIWKLATSEDLELKAFLDEEPTFATPFRVFAILLSAPTMLFMDAFWWLIERPIVGLAVLAIGFLWSFVQGAFILTQVFGLT